LYVRCIQVFIVYPGNSIFIKGLFFFKKRTGNEKEELLPKFFVVKIGFSFDVGDDKLGISFEDIK